MPSVRIALAAGLGITAVAVAVVLSQSPLTVAATNSAPTREELGIAGTGVETCQAGERLPRDTSAIRLSLGAFTGPGVTVKALSGTRVLTSGERGPGWAGQPVTIPVRAVSEAVFPVRVCFETSRVGGEEVTVFGAHTVTATAARTGKGEALGGRMRIDYLRAGSSSWLSLAPQIARRMGLGHAWAGTWIVFLLAALMSAAATLVSWRIVKDLG